MASRMTQQAASRARAALVELGETLRRWKRVDAIRSQLPAKFRARVPASRYGVALGILHDLQRRGAVRVQGGGFNGFGDSDGFGWAQLAIVAGAIVLVAGAAAVAIVAAAIPRIKAEARASKQAERAAMAARRAWAAEQAQAGQVGVERARQLAAQRAGEQASLLFPSSVPSLPLPGEPAPAADLTMPEGGAGGFLGLPAWVLPVGLIVVGAGAAFALSRK